MAKRLVFPATDDLATKVRKYFRAKAIGKANYAKADKLLAEIVAQTAVGHEIPLNSAGRKAVLVDVFEGKLVAYRAHGIRRYELEMSD